MATALAFFKGLPWRWIGVGVLAVGLAYLIVQGINSVKDWRQEIYDDAYKAGQQQANAAWLQTRNDEAALAINRLAKQVEANNTAVTGYLADIDARQVLVQQTTEEIGRYASTPAGTAVCLDADGVRVLQQARAAATATPGSPSANPRP